MRTVFKVSIAVLLFAGLAWASNPWTSKPYTQWSKKDVLQVLNNSPWSQMKSVPVTWKMPSGRGRRVSRGAYGPVDKIEVRWQSAKAIREALVRENILMGKMTEKQAAAAVAKKLPIYEMVLFGQDLSQFSKMSDADVAKGAFIEGRQTKVKAVALQAKVQRANGRVLDVLFAFPKTVGGKPVIGPGERQLNVQVTANKMKIKANFNTQKMVNKAGLLDL